MIRSCGEILINNDGREGQQYCPIVVHMASKERFSGLIDGFVGSEEYIRFVPQLCI
jgi:hypothetical protein